MKFEQDVRDEVAALLQKLLDSCDVGDPNPETYKNVLDRLTRMAILGTAPPASKSNVTSQDTSRNTTTVGVYKTDFSKEKESFIAP